MLQDAQIAYPKTKFKQGGPLELDITVLERLPTAEEFQDIYSLLDEASWTIFFKTSSTDSGGFRAHPTSARSLLDALGVMQQQARKHAKESKDPDAAKDVDHPLFGTGAFQWPIVVCWEDRQIAFGGFKSLQKMLRRFAQDRDGITIRTQAQVKEEEEKVKRARWQMPPKETSPREDETLEWFSEMSNRPRRRGPSW